MTLIQLRRPMRLHLTALAGVTVLAAGLVCSLASGPALAQSSKPVAQVDGKVITEADVKLADQEIGPNWGNCRRRRSAAC